MNGVINFLKPPGMSSNGAVVFLRGLLGVKKTGHAGTLDPGACGVLPICVGKATRISSYMMGGSKEYIAEVTFAKSTDTGDSYGSVTSVSDVSLPSEEAVKSALEVFSGLITQQTPAYSAVKHEGQKLYELARRGIEVDPKHREIMIYEAEYLRQTRVDAHLLRIVCGKGTYIRQLCEDIGQRLGIPAYMSFLVRTKCAGLDIDNAYTADELKQMREQIKDALLPIDVFLSAFPRIEADKRLYPALINGNNVNDPGDNIDKASIYVQGRLLGIGQRIGGQLKISTMLVER
jgi:tRNA pseudouridine55 synthase